MFLSLYNIFGTFSKAKSSKNRILAHFMPLRVFPTIQEQWHVWKVFPPTKSFEIICSEPAVSVQQLYMSQV
jgi:hypothetical protein